MLESRRDTSYYYALSSDTVAEFIRVLETLGSRGISKFQFPGLEGHGISARIMETHEILKDTVIQTRLLRIPRCLKLNIFPLNLSLSHLLSIISNSRDLDQFFLSPDCSK